MCLEAGVEPNAHDAFRLPRKDWLRLYFVCCIHPMLGAGLGFEPSLQGYEPRDRRNRPHSLGAVGGVEPHLRVMSPAFYH